MSENKNVMQSFWDYIDFIVYNSLIKSNTKQSMKIDKATLEAYDKAPETLRLSIPCGVDVGDSVTVGLTTKRVTEATGNRFIRLGKGGPSMFTEDGFDDLEVEDSYIHIKNGKRFVPYRVTAVSGDRISVRKVSLPTSVEGSASKTALRAAQTAKTKATTSLAKALAHLKDAENALR